MRPEIIKALGEAAKQFGAVEIIYLRGALDVVTGGEGVTVHDKALDPGQWLLVRFPAGDVPMDGTMETRLNVQAKPN